MAVASEMSGQSQPPDMEDYQQTSMWPATKQALLKIDQRRQRLRPVADMEHFYEKDNTFADEESFEELLRFSKIAISHQESLAQIVKALCLMTFFCSRTNGTGPVGYLRLYDGSADPRFFI